MLVDNVYKGVGETTPFSEFHGHQSKAGFTVESITVFKKEF